jgi:RHS repeat-associated protein
MTADVPAQGLAGAVTKYYYDDTYRLIRTDYPNVAPFNGEVDSWTYDAVGNRLSSSANGQVQTYAYEKIGLNPKNLQRLLSDGVYAYSHDLNGSLVSRSSPSASYTFAWDALGRLASLSGSTAAAYRYDHRGRRTSQTAGGATTTHLYSRFDLIADGGAAAASYLSGPGVDQPLAALRGGIPYFYEVDGLGSVILSTDLQGSVQTSSVFDAWGSLRSYSGSSPDPFAYTGREFGDGEMLHFRNRWLLPSIGRFISEDPLFSRSGLGLYSYVNGDPTNAVDPFGLQESGVCRSDDPPYPPFPDWPVDPPHWDPPDPWEPLPLRPVEPVWTVPDPPPPPEDKPWFCPRCAWEHFVEEYDNFERNHYHVPGEELNGVPILLPPPEVVPFP